ncbi:hypothetical protein TcasGA2_TC004024 [Tribolium castaneum]|uniref:Protein sleepless n=1 Tax=Tribolium castaneum TaxID=7070 RepID=D6WIV3_TRICA|nr:PREDICTED: uncharacterized protein LOC103314140 [Tribolium castaneum]EFA01101.1 hypothetical protein TcasGA2_TC004024 [Tribolium castaneum]|eukprot:XP_008197445.1 PREDICTED: uncharacterized protein LOC103314140 [Tribolium castaneum]
MKIYNSVFLVALLALLHSQSTKAGVTKCYEYVSVHRSNESPVIQNCPSFGDFRCLSANGMLGNLQFEVKACVSSMDVIIDTTCTQVNTSGVGECYMCDSDLCNLAPEPNNTVAEIN